MFAEWKAWHSQMRSLYCKVSQLLSSYLIMSSIRLSGAGLVVLII